MYIKVKLDLSKEYSLTHPTIPILKPFGGHGGHRILSHEQVKLVRDRDSLADDVIWLIIEFEALGSRK